MGPGRQAQGRRAGPPCAAAADLPSGVQGGGPAESLPQAPRRPAPALTSSISSSTMLGGCGAPAVASTAVHSSTSSRHPLVAAATAAMATTPYAAKPGHQAN
jgi:hypothetical protein